MNRLLVAAAIVLLSSTPFLAGCGGDEADIWSDSRPKPFAAEGVVLYRDKPVEGAMVTFSPEDPAQKGAIGTTDSSGKFQLMTYAPGDGALPGKYLVTIIKHTESTGSIGDTAPESDPTPKPLEPLGSAIPKRYQTTGDSGLTASVSEAGPNHFEFQLKD